RAGRAHRDGRRGDAAGWRRDRRGARRHLADRLDAPVDATQRAGLDAARRHDPAAGENERADLFHAHPSTPRARRVSTSRQAMRMATPISTWSVMIERPGMSATVLSISTPRFIGPGCI